MKHVYLAIVCFAVVLLGHQTAWTQAFPINTNVALQPAEGQFIYRTQLRYRSFDIDGPDADVDVLTNSHVLVYGWTSRFSTVLGVPLRYRHFEQAGRKEDDVGIGDINGCR